MRRAGGARSTQHRKNQGRRLAALTQSGIEHLEHPYTRQLLEAAFLEVEGS